MESRNLINKAREYCETKKHRFTLPRERVLSILKQAKIPMGAYQILEALSSSHEKVNPPTIYRAIEFWLKHGFIHRIESMNAFIVCCEHLQHDNFCIFICDGCQQVIELDMCHLPAPMTNDIVKKQLKITHASTEVHGKCRQCQ